MSSYRFCRTDDIGLLVEALNRCWAPYFPAEPAMTPATFKRSIRDLQVWCSSCMVAFAGADPIAVLIGAKRPSATLIHKIAVHPDHRRHGHGRHLLTSLASKLAILGPPRIMAEIPEALAPARALFTAAGYVEETVLTDYVCENATPAQPPPAGGESRIVIPVTIDDLAANGLLEQPHPGCWERSIETLTARKDDIAGLAVADERIEACILYLKPGASAATSSAEIVSLNSFVDDDGARLTHLLGRLRAQGLERFRFPKVHPAEVSNQLLERLGFRAHEGYVREAATARPG